MAFLAAIPAAIGLSSAAAGATAGAVGTGVATGASLGGGLASAAAVGGTAASTAGTLGTIANVASAVGALGSVASTFMGGMQQAGASDAAAHQAKLNAKAEASDAEREYQALLARQRTLTGASGVQPIGSPLGVMLESAKEAELQEQRIKHRGKMYASMKQSEASSYRTGAVLSGLAGSAKAGGMLAQIYSRMA